MPLNLVTAPSLETALAPLVETRQALKAQVAALEAQIDSINDDIKTTLVNAGELEVLAAGHKVTLNMAAERTTLDKQKLLEQGVTTEQIKKATKTTTSILLNVRPVKESA